MANPNLFDGRLSMMYWTPRSVAEMYIEELADNLRTYAPYVNSVMIKTNNGIGWQGAYDSSKPNLAINSVEDVQRWSNVLAARGLECHAWCVVRGSVVQQEIDRIAQICLAGGVKSMVLDLEEGSDYFVGDMNAARALAQGLRDRLPDTHLGLMFDARGTHPQTVWVQSVWYPEIDSLHPMVYHYHFGQTAGTALANCYSVVGNWGKPVYPCLEAYTPFGYARMPESEVLAAANVATSVHRAPGLSYFRYGWGMGTPDAGINRNELQAIGTINLPSGVPSPDVPAPRLEAIPGAAPTLVIVDPSNERTGEFTIGYYGDPEQLSPGWVVDIDLLGRPRAYRPAIYNAQTLYVGYQPRLTGVGRYSIEAYIPRNHGYARDVRYTVVHYPGGQRQEVTCILNQEPYSDQWAPLQGNIVDGAAGAATVGEFDLDPAYDDAGRVNVADATFVDPRTSPTGKFEITFGSLRWRPVVTGFVVTQPTTVIGFDAPVGTEAERAGPIGTGGKFGEYPIWLGNWYDANPFGSRYLLSNGYARHTGADLNLTSGVLADKDAPIYATADGRVISASWVSSGWKNIIIIEHPVPNEDRVIYARYAHVGNMRVKAGDPVQRGQQIATVGEFAPNNWHLHFDISPTTVLKTTPGHWPGDNLSLVQQHYADPLVFIQQRHVVR